MWCKPISSCLKENFKKSAYCLRETKKELRQYLKANGEKATPKPAENCLDQSNLIDPTRYIDRLPLARLFSTNQTRRVIRL